MILNFNKPTIISFGAEVVGTNSPVETVSIVISNGKSWYAVSCGKTTEGNWEATVPEFSVLDSYVPGIKQLLIEFKIAGRVFVPFKQEVSFNQEIEWKDAPAPIAEPIKYPAPVEVPSTISTPVEPTLDLAKEEPIVNFEETQVEVKPKFDFFKTLETAPHTVGVIEPKVEAVEVPKKPKKTFEIKKFDDKEGVVAAKPVSKEDFLFTEGLAAETPKPEPVKEEIKTEPVPAPKKTFEIKKFDDKKEITTAEPVSKKDFMFSEEQTKAKPKKEKKEVPVTENIFIKLHKTEVIYL